jgi:hypothetical protein
LPDVARHVVEAVAIWGKRFHRRDTGKSILTCIVNGNCWCSPRTSLFAIAFVSVTCLQAQDPLAYYNWFINEFWRFVFAHQEVGKCAQTFLEYPPMQEGASFNMYAERTHK